MAGNGIFDPACELLPPWTKELYLFSDLLPPPPLPKLNVQHIQAVCGCGGWGVQLCCRPYSAGVLHSVSDQIKNLQNCFTTQNKMTSKRRHLGIGVFKVSSSMVLLFSSAPSWIGQRKSKMGTVKVVFALPILKGWMRFMWNHCHSYTITLPPRPPDSISWHTNRAIYW